MCYIDPESVQASHVFESKMCNMAVKRAARSILMYAAIVQD